MSRGAGSGLAAAVIFAGIAPLASVATLISYLAPRGIPWRVWIIDEFDCELMLTCDT